MGNFVPPSDGNDLAVFFLAQGEQNGAQIAHHLADFVAGAHQSLDIAIYDLRLSEPYKSIISGALQERAAAGVQIRIAYDADKPPAPDLAAGQDPAPSGTGAFVQALGYPWQRIGGLKLMHNKYLVRDAGTAQAQVWTGSTNLTDDAFTKMENNILEIRSPALAAYYAHDFQDLWQKGHIEDTGAFDTMPVQLAYAQQTARVQLLFSPGRGSTIDHVVAERVAQAQRRVRICSMLLNSGALINALTDVLGSGRLDVRGIYDRTQMLGVWQQWQDVPSNHWKIPAVQAIIQTAQLVGKNSTPYSPSGVHDFMHNKVLVIDDTVITGSYNFSRSAELNAENILLIDSPALAAQYVQYIDHLMQKYS